MEPLEADEGSLSSRLVRSSDQIVHFEDGVDAPMAGLDALCFQIGFYGFSTPPMFLPDFKDPGHSLFW